MDTLPLTKQDSTEVVEEEDKTHTGSVEVKVEEDDDLSESTKRKEDESTLGQTESEPSRKKQRVVWTSELHDRFVAAVDKLGIDKAVPKKIMEIMDVPGITRENVASHLQKYRQHLKKQQGGDTQEKKPGRRQQQHCEPNAVTPADQNAIQTLHEVHDSSVKALVEPAVQKSIQYDSCHATYFSSAVELRRQQRQQQQQQSVALLRQQLLQQPPPPPLAYQQNHDIGNPIYYSNPNPDPFSMQSLVNFVDSSNMNPNPTVPPQHDPYNILRNRSNSPKVELNYSGMQPYPDHLFDVSAFLNEIVAPGGNAQGGELPFHNDQINQFNNAADAQVYDQLKDFIFH